MSSTFIAIFVLVVAAVVWVVSTQRKLVVLDENVSSAMSQIGVQLSSRLDALTALLDLTKNCAGHEVEPLMETVKSKRSTITATSTPEDVLRQEEVIAEVLRKISTMAERFPELKSNPSYLRTLNAVDTFDNMVRTSRLIYNDSVAKFNREIRMFPTSAVAGMLGFRQREYLVEADKGDMSAMK